MYKQFVITLAIVLAISQNWKSPRGKFTDIVPLCTASPSYQRQNTGIHSQAVSPKVEPSVGCVKHDCIVPYAYI